MLSPSWRFSAGSPKTCMPPVGSWMYMLSLRYVPCRAVTIPVTVIAVPRAVASASTIEMTHPRFAGAGMNAVSSR